jgi:putative chitinase
MPQHRAAVFGVVRPWLDAQGYTPDRIAALDRALAAAGVPADAPDAPAPAPASGPQSAPVAMIDATLLKIACPENELVELALWVEPIKAACMRWGIDTMREVAAFLAQAGHESSGLTRLSENLNYRAERLCQVWPKRFPSVGFAQSYAGNPEKLANYVYASRLGNGPPESGDGFRFRGYGPFQLTGRNNHTAFAAAIGMPLEQATSYIRTREGAAMSAAWFWHENGLDRLAATAGVEDETQAINGGQIGLADRRARFDAVIAEMLRREKAA